MSKSVYMSEKKAKKAILDIGQRMYVRNFVAANDGNISIRTGENEVWATPTGVSKGFMKRENACEGGSRGKCTGGNEEAFL
ncbi:MAG: class II aldolase/adducin family protein [Suilimivivens sp.]